MSAFPSGNIPVGVAGLLWLRQLDIADPWAKAGQVAVGVLLGLYVVVQVLERVLPLVKSAKKDSSGKWRAPHMCNPACEARMLKMAGQMTALYEWHNVVDPRTGARLWYTNTDVLSRLTEILDRLTTETQKMRHDVEGLRRDIASKSKIE